MKSKEKLKEKYCEANENLPNTGVAARVALRGIIDFCQPHFIVVVLMMLYKT